MKKNMIRLVSFLAVFCLVFSVLTHIYTLKDLDPYGNDRTAVFSQFYNEPQNSFDVIMIGTSRIRSSLLPAVLWDEAGITSYNLAMSGGPILTMYHWLKEALKRQSPSVVIVHAGWLYRPRNVDTAEVRYRESMDPMPLSINKAKAIYRIVSKSKKQNALDYIFPLLRYHARTDLKESDFDFTYSFKRNMTMGGRTNMRNGFSIVLPEDFWEVPREPRTIKDEKNMENIINLCKDNGISVVMVDTPSTVDNDWAVSSPEISQAWADKHGIEYVNLNSKEVWEETAFDGKTDFGDVNHVNISGATKNSRYIARYLSKKYGLTDHRTEEYDPHWDEVLNYYTFHYDRFHEIVNIKSSTDVSEYLELLKKYSDCYIFMAGSDKYMNHLNEDDRRALKKLGLETDFSAGSKAVAFYAAINNGKVIGEKASSHKLKFKKYLSPLNVVIESSESTASIMINEEPKSQNLKGLNIVVYDKVLGKIVDSVNFGTHTEDVPVTR